MPTLSKPRLITMVIAILLAWPPDFAPAQTGTDRNENQAQRFWADELISLDPRSAVFKIVDGKNEGDQVPLRISSADQGRWRLAFEDLYTLIIREDAGGAVLVEQMELHEKGKRILFNPPVTLIPELIRAGQRIRLSGTAVIYNLKTGEQTRRGAYDYTLNEISQAEFNTPVGSISGYLLEYDFRIHLDLAVTRIDLETGWSTNRKLVYWRNKSTVEKLGFFGSTTLRTLALAEREFP